MIIIFTGDGKGKTTAALGQALRANGNGSRVLMVEFVKGPWKSGEDVSTLRLGDSFKIVKKGKGFVKILGDKLPFTEHVAAAKEGLSYAIEEARRGEWDILILDEIWTALSLSLFSNDDVKRFLEQAAPHLDHLILTGRGCPKEFIERADLVTEMKEVKHPFKSGMKAMANVEF